MKSLLAGMLAITVLGYSVTVFADDQPEQPNYGGRLLMRHEMQLQKEKALQIRIERAQLRKRQRIAAEREPSRLRVSEADPFGTRTR